MLIYARKAALACTYIIFRTSASYQLALALLILFGAYVVHVKNMPYMTHSNKSQVLEEHARKALTDPVHATIEVDMRAVAKMNVRKRMRANVFDVHAAKRNASTTALLSLFDYNTAESVLLASALLTVLSGESLPCVHVCFPANACVALNAPAVRARGPARTHTHTQLLC